MHYLLVRQRFSAYASWRPVFDALDERRAASGIRTVLVTVNAHDRSEAVVLFAYDDPAALREHFDSPALRAAHRRAGVVEGSIQATELESVD